MEDPYIEFFIGERINRFGEDRTSQFLRHPTGCLEQDNELCSMPLALSDGDGHIFPDIQLRPQGFQVCRVW